MSKPSSVFHCGHLMTPALFISMSTCGSSTVETVLQKQALLPYLKLNSSGFITLFDPLCKLSDWLHGGQVEATCINVRIQGFPPNFLCSCFALLHIATSHNNPTTWWCWDCFFKKKARCVSEREVVAPFCTKSEGNQVLHTSSSQFSGSLFSNACVSSCYNHSLFINGSLTRTPASSHTVSMKIIKQRFIGILFKHWRLPLTLLKDVSVL